MGCFKCGITTIVVLLNVLVHLCGAAMLGLGVWAMVGDESCFHGVIIGNTGHIVILVIVAGVVIMPTTCLGCYATVNESKKGIVSYSIFSFLVVTAQVVGCILLFIVYRNQVEKIETEFKEFCPTEQSPADFIETQVMFEKFYYAISGASIFSVMCELIALLLIVFQYQDIL